MQELKPVHRANPKAKSEICMMEEVTATEIQMDIQKVTM
jgi:hypothetical protein